MKTILANKLEACDVDATDKKKIANLRHSGFQNISLEEEFGPNDTPRLKLPPMNNLRHS